MLHNAGCKLIIASRRVEELERVKNKLLATSTVGEDITVLQLDLADLPGLKKKAEEVLRMHGQVDILINNGGISYRGEVAGTDIDVDQRLMLVNYFGQIALTKGWTQFRIAVMIA